MLSLGYYVVWITVCSHLYWNLVEVVCFSTLSISIESNMTLFEASTSVFPRCDSTSGVVGCAYFNANSLDIFVCIAMAKLFFGLIHFKNTSFLSTPCFTSDIRHAFRFRVLLYKSVKVCSELRII
jgi:hypothetical protein